jgi:DNA polymerase
MLNKALVARYLHQQKQMSPSNLVFSIAKADLQILFSPIKNLILSQTKMQKAVPQPVNEPVRKPVTQPESVKKIIEAQTKSVSTDSNSLSSRLSGLRTVAHLVPSKPDAPEPKVNIASDPAFSILADTTAKKDKKSLSYDEKRGALKELYFTGCKKCPLSSTRKTFVFGSGNAGASVMVIGEAPGAEEDDQGLPFVGAAGQLLTSMLSAIKLDRNKDVFIANVLKCRPPENRNPESSEIITCLPLLKRQIEIIQPKAILLLGRIAAHSLLGNADSISKMRSQVLYYEGIPSMVIYHPAALLRNAEYKRPAWEDLKKFQSLLTDIGAYGISEI